MRLRGGRRAAAFAALLLTGGCAAPETALEPRDCARPEITSTEILPVSSNVLAALVRAELRAVDSATVRFGRAGTALDSSTATVAARGSVIIPVFGLHAATDYTMQVIASNGCGVTAGEHLSVSTGALPADLPVYEAGGTDPSPGYVVFAAGNYGVVIDNTGRVVWYHRFDVGPGLNFQPQPNGRYAARPPNAAPGASASWVEIDLLGNRTRALGCERGLQPRLHDLLAEPDGSYWILCDEIATLDLTSQGRSDQQAVLGTTVQHIGAAGDLLFEWRPFDHLEVDLGDLQPGDLGGPVINWTHGNALDLDADGNLLVSFRNLNQITKIDTRTGAVIWHMGGSRNQFTFENVAGLPFARQHGLRSVGGGQLLLLDNLGEPERSRAELYQYDEARRTVRLIGEYVSSTGVVAHLGGSTQPLTDGRVLVSFGNGGSVEEYAPAGELMWRMYGSPGYVFRAQRIRSLYQPGVGDPR